MSTPESTMKLLRTRIGLLATDTDQDEMLDAAWQAALDWAEEYCDRDFRGGEITEVILMDGGSRISLRGYLIESVMEIIHEDGSEITKFMVNRPSGLLKIHHPVCGEISVTYHALPVERGPAFLALLGAFDAAFGILSGAAGGGEIKSTSIDGMRVDFTTDAQTSAELAGLPESVAGLLAPFKRMYC